LVEVQRKYSYCIMPYHRECRIGLLEQRKLGVEVPIVKHVAEHNHIGRRQRVAEEVSFLKTRPRAEARLLDVVREDWAHAREIKPDGREVRMPTGNLQRARYMAHCGGIIAHVAAFQ
jgi:hypothetical protein